jgi:hypothetical protein
MAGTFASKNGKGIMVMDEAHRQDTVLAQSLRDLMEKGVVIGRVKARLDLLTAIPYPNDREIEVEKLSEDVDRILAWMERMRATILDALASRDHAERIARLEQWRHDVRAEALTQKGLSLSVQQNWLALVAIVIALLVGGFSAIVGMVTLFNLLGVLP